jgi:hypothetical protein
MGTFARAIGLGLALVAIAVGVGVATGDVKRQFEEEGVLTWFSTALLLACAWSAWQVFRRRDGTIHAGVWRESRFLWALIAVAFVFLAADELLKIHETADHAVHDALGLVESRLSDRLDDATSPLAFGSLRGMAFGRSGSEAARKRDSAITFSASSKSDSRTAPAIQTSCVLVSRSPATIPKKQTSAAPRNGSSGRAKRSSARYSQSTSSAASP